jgi:PAS domain-containing protein
MEKARTKKRVHFEFRHRLADGSIRDVEVFSSRIEVKGKDFLHSIIHDITDRKQAEEDKKELILELREALSQVKSLSGLLPICASCKKIRDDKGSWKQIEAYIRERSKVEFSHGICPECAKRLYPDFFE